MSGKNGNKAHDAPPPCPYCARPELLKEPTVEPTGEIYAGLRAGKPWNRQYTSGLVKAFAYGDHWRGAVPNKALSSRFKDFSVVSIGLDVGFKTPPPPPFPNHIASLRAKRPEVVPNPSFPYSALTLFSAYVITHKHSLLTLEAHWWPTHGLLINLQGHLAPNATNDDLEVAREALEFFREETRGNAKITDERIRVALTELGTHATQIAAAKVMEVSESALEKWRRRRGIDTWQEVVSRYS
jgi:hypothetical protein